eukprot:5265-Heterococcus_DN1.PRE.1
MLSSMFDVDSNVCYDSICSTHFNERTSAKQHVDASQAGDTLIFDRGYYSKNLLEYSSHKGVQTLFRLKCDAFKLAKLFFNSSATYKPFNYCNDDGNFSTAYLYKYTIDGKVYMCVTNYQSTCKAIKALYAKRWKVETGFRRLKTNLHLENRHSMSLKLFVQQIQATILLDTLTMLLRPHIAPTKKHAQTYYTDLDVLQDVLFILQICSTCQMTFLSIAKILRKRNYLQSIYNSSYDQQLEGFA